MVAINCAHIGDDNDYSCFLHNAVFELWQAGKQETAYCLFLTDPALVDFKDKAEFEKEMNRLKMIRDEEQENQRAYYKNYVD